MKPTHYYVNNRNEKVLGRIVAPAYANAWWFLPICNDNETWMLIPVWVVGVSPL